MVWCSLVLWKLGGDKRELGGGLYVNCGEAKFKLAWESFWGWRHPYDGHLSPIGYDIRFFGVLTPVFIGLLERIGAVVYSHQCPLCHLPSLHDDDMASSHDTNDNRGHQLSQTTIALLSRYSDFLGLP
jgi:hypothetical protein